MYAGVSLAAPQLVGVHLVVKICIVMLPGRVGNRIQNTLSNWLPNGLHTSEILWYIITLYIIRLLASTIKRCLSFAHLMLALRTLPVCMH